CKPTTHAPTEALRGSVYTAKLLSFRDISNYSVYFFAKSLRNEVFADGFVDRMNGVETLKSGKN
ncbi:MAG: hypothetical protein J1E84_04170, partial [Muribaculaceae bacterium]|nr:hypothetical protein [Muribaculaceae bacterium]